MPIDDETDMAQVPDIPVVVSAARWLKRLAPWLPITMLVVSVIVNVILQIRVGGGGFSVLWWMVALLVSVLAGTKTPGLALLVLVFLLPVMPYFRYDVWPGKSLPSLIGAAVLIGVAFSSRASWSGLLRDRRQDIAIPVLSFAALLALSTMMVLLQRSPFFLGLTEAVWPVGQVSSNWPTLQPQSTLPILRSGWFLLGPVAGLTLLSFLAYEQDEAHQLVRRESVIAIFLLTSALNLAVACGQVYIPDFPITTLREPVSGLFHNPVGLSLLMTLAAPVALAISLRPTRIAWLRPLAVSTVVLVALIFIPIEQRSAHLGVAVGVAYTLASSGLVLARSNRPAFRRLIVTTGVIAVLLALGLAGAFARTSQWQQVRTAMSHAPLSTVWLGTGVRQETNRLALFMVGDRLFGGYGMGGFEAALPAYYERYGPSVRRYDYHSILNHPLHMFVDLGIFGLAGNLWLLGAFFIPSLRGVFVRAGPQGDETGIDPTALGCAGGAVAVLVLSLWTAEWLYDPSISVMTFVLLALAIPQSKVTGSNRPTATVWAILALPLAHVVAFTMGI